MFNTCQFVYHRGNCLNNKKPFATPCRLCIDNCPHQAITKDYDIKAKLCTECGACTAICPSDGIVDHDSDKLYDYLSTAEQIQLNCPQAIPTGFEIPCLGVMDQDLWMALMLEAQKKKVEITTGECSRCPDKKACAQGVKMFTEVHKSWPDHSPVVITVAPDDGKSKSLPLNKKIAPSSQSEKTGWRNLGREKLEEMFPGMTSDEAYPIPHSRLFFVESWETKNEILPLPALNIGEGCTNCGVCAAICPQGALTKKESHDELTLIYEPFKCVRCQRCVSVCRFKALTMENKRLSFKLFTGKILLHQGKYRYCIKCGRQVFDNQEPPLCIACATSDPNFQPLT
ncbi:4Fe-4S dicluster domain-containing protein [Desulfitobacterium sp.]|uniref:4Fe-4S dicluster domain-containing protein n=1 Tax=Desulfitobacterium sp. TaxID=49981 RepID=UPI002B1F6978|nr:4Fe-4S dicluster domain-containing protein [Desulfitobacterium sp.]MEA4902397.1 4Fe-4S dicluster domain-containing protein [Desulfitobacterium sp.]